MKTNKLKNLFRIVSKYRVKIIITYFLFLLNTIYLIIEPSVNGWATEQIIVFKNPNYGVLILFLYWAIYGVFNFFEQIYDTIVFSKINLDLSLKLVNAHLKKQTNTSTVVAHTELISEFTTFLETDIVSIISTLLNFIASLLLLMVINIYMGLIAILSIPFVIIINKNYSKRYQIITKSKTI